MLLCDGASRDTPTIHPVYVSTVWGFGIDPALRVDVFDELKLGETFAGVFQVQGFHNESRAYLFQGRLADVMS